MNASEEECMDRLGFDCKRLDDKTVVETSTLATD